MESKRIVVVGGVAGGMSFATRYRRLNQDDHIIILDKGPHVSFANCGLPYYISQEIENREDLLVAKPEMLVNRFQLDIRTEHEVLAIDKSSKTLRVRYNGKEHDLAYDTLVLSPGAKPIRLNIEGMTSHNGIFTLRNIPDADNIVSYIETHNPKSAVVIGAGFIGLEMAENLKQRGMDVSVVEKAPQVLPPFDPEMAVFAHKTLEDNGIACYVDTSIVKIDKNVAYLEDGTAINADLVIMAVGVRPETEFTKSAGLDLGMRGGIVVDERFQTSDPNIYAIGDAILVKNIISQERSLISLASPANRQGRQLADILSGYKKTYKGSLGTAILRLFDTSFASTGLNERQLKNRNYEVLHTIGNDHASYFPGATPIYFKLLFDPETREILGAQALGEKGVDKRIDVIATAIKAGYPVEDLQELELTYAPPFGTAKDIVNVAGYIAENIIVGRSHTVQWHELERLQNEGAVLVDVRTPEEFSEGHIEGAIHHPLDSIRCSMNQLDTEKEIIVYCRSAGRSYNAEQILRASGFKVQNLDGSFGYYSMIKPERIVKHV